MVSLGLAVNVVIDLARAVFGQVGKAMPRARVSTVTAVNPGLLKNERKPKRKS